jgi:pyruvate,water dikinase
MAAAGGASEARPAAAVGRRLAARALVDRTLRHHPVRRLGLGWLLRVTSRRLRDRENLRLERTRLFARVRTIFLELGRRLQADGLLDDPRDVFYLEVGELLAFVDGRSTLVDLRGLAALRRREFEGYAAAAPPDARFETRGPVYGQSHRRPVASSRPSGSEDAERRGLGCSPGIVRGGVRVVTDPRSVDVGERAVLVAAHTDPGWVLVFPSALAVVVERGSPLSHAAIVARELGIPAVVSVAGASSWLADGDWVEVDGTAGVVRRVPAADGPDVTNRGQERAVAHA